MTSRSLLRISGAHQQVVRRSLKNLILKPIIKVRPFLQGLSIYRFGLSIFLVKRTAELLHAILDFEIIIEIVR